MAHSLEVRTPFLDRSIVEFAFRLPTCWKLWHGQEKSILKSLARKYVPSVAKHRKPGLHIPEGSLLSPAFREFSLSTLLSGNSLFPRAETERLLRSWFFRQPCELRFLQTMLRLQLWWDTFLAPGSRGMTLSSTPLAAQAEVAVREHPIERHPSRFRC